MQHVNFDLNKRKLAVDLRDEADRSVFNEIFKYKEYRIAEEAIKNARHPILDIGAHAGFFSLYCHVQNPKAKIFALEPEPENFKFLQKNLKMNKVRTVKSELAAMGGASGKRRLELTPDSHNHRLLESGRMSKNKSIEVQCYSLADFCGKNKIKKVSLLKMDIEGGEKEVFSGMSPSDFMMVNCIILEYHNNSERTRIEARLRENGFGVQIFPSHFDKTMGFLFANNKRTSYGGL